jgi:hypothetical protein
MNAPIDGKERERVKTIENLVSMAALLPNALEELR